MSKSPTNGLSPLYDMRCKLTAAQKEVERLQAVEVIASRRLEVIVKQDHKIERLRTALKDVEDIAKQAFSEIFCEE